MTDDLVQTGSPDTGPLLAEFRGVVAPASVDFLENRISAQELRERWRPYYFEAFHHYDLAVEQSWRQASGSTGRIESGPPTADPEFERQLQVTWNHADVTQRGRVNNSITGNVTGKVVQAGDIHGNISF